MRHLTHTLGTDLGLGYAPTDEVYGADPSWCHSNRAAWRPPNPIGRRSFDSFLEFGTLGGFTLGAVISTALITTLSDEAISRWGWRIRSWSHSHSVSSGSTCG